MTLISSEARLLNLISRLNPAVHDVVAYFQHISSIWLLYDGQHIFVYSGSYGQRGTPIDSYKATSGLPGSQWAREMKSRDAGPVPEGKYWILLLPDPNRIAKSDPKTGDLFSNPKGGIEKIPDFYDSPLMHARIRYPGWGKTRARLFPDKTTNTFGRSNFYLHDSHKGFSHGCIEVEPGLFLRLLAARKNFTKIALMVDYPNDNTFTNGGTKW